MSDSPSGPTTDEPRASTEEDVSVSESSYAGSDGATASEQDIEDALNAAATLAIHSNSPSQSPSGQSSPGNTSSHDKAKGIASTSEESGDQAAAGSSSAGADISRSRSSTVKGSQDRESVVDFFRAVPGPEASAVPQYDGPFTSAKKRTGYQRMSSDSPSSSVTEEAVVNTAGADLTGSVHRRARASTSSQINSEPARSNTGPPSPDSRRNAMYLREGSTSTVPSPDVRTGNRTDSRDIVLPRWQPDAEVTYCPICNTQFSFFVRKHHCRKCGRVVCNSCSPHRITIPYQFIVQDGSGQGPDGRPHQSSVDIHGGMKVRLCNPCVPDPNIAPPQPEGPPPSYYLATGDRGFNLTEEAISDLERRQLAQMDMPAVNRELSAHSRQRAATASSRLSTADRRQQRSDPIRSRYESTVSPSGGSSSYQSNRMSARIETSGRTRYAPTNTSQSRGHASRHQSLSIMSSGSARPDVGVDRNRPLPPVPRIPEEDECPVCHRELPSRTLPNHEMLREQHVIQCIDDQISAHRGQPRPGAYTSNSQPPPSASSVASPSEASTSTSIPITATASASTSTPSTLLPLPANLQHLTAPGISGSFFPNTAPMLPVPIANTPEARMAAREQAHAAVVLGRNNPATSPSAANIRRTGMFPYKATEKDCVDDAECTICLEEFEVGVPMARLECLCRFHRECIQEWFVGHPGMCPVHQHDGYGF